MNNHRVESHEPAVFRKEHRAGSSVLASCFLVHDVKQVPRSALCSVSFICKREGDPGELRLVGRGEMSRNPGAL